MFEITLQKQLSHCLRCSLGCSKYFGKTMVLTLQFWGKSNSHVWHFGVSCHCICRLILSFPWNTRMATAIIKCHQNMNPQSVVSASCLKGLFEKQLPYQNVILAELLQLNLAQTHLRWGDFDFRCFPDLKNSCWMGTAERLLHSPKCSFIHTIQVKSVSSLQMSFFFPVSFYGISSIPFSSFSQTHVLLSWFNHLLHSPADPPLDPRALWISYLPSLQRKILWIAQSAQSAATLA